MSPAFDESFGFDSAGFQPLCATPGYDFGFSLGPEFFVLKSTSHPASHHPGWKPDNVQLSLHSRCLLKVSTGVPLGPSLVWPLPATSMRRRSSTRFFDRTNFLSSAPLFKRRVSTSQESSVLEIFGGGFHYRLQQPKSNSVTAAVAAAAVSSSPMCHSRTRCQSLPDGYNHIGCIFVRSLQSESLPAARRTMKVFDRITAVIFYHENK